MIVLKRGEDMSDIKKINKCAKVILCSIASMAFTGCTYNVSMAHTEGTAKDTIDSEQTTTPRVDSALNVPIHSEAPVNIEVPPKAE